MELYRHLPTVVEAIEWTGDNRPELQEFCGQAPGSWVKFRTNGELVRSMNQPAFRVHDSGLAELWTEKSGSWCLVETGDFVIRERDGTGAYPCQRDEFLSAYESVHEEVLS